MPFHVEGDLRAACLTASCGEVQKLYGLRRLCLSCPALAVFLPLDKKAWSFLGLRCWAVVPWLPVQGGKALLALALSHLLQGGWVGPRKVETVKGWFPSRENKTRDQVGLHGQVSLWAASLAHSCPLGIVVVLML